MTSREIEIPFRALIWGLLLFGLPSLALFQGLRAVGEGLAVQSERAVHANWDRQLEASKDQLERLFRAPKEQG